MKLGAKIFGVLSLGLVLFLLLGILLPGTWMAETEATLSAPPSTVFPFLNRMDQWILWNPVPESGSGVMGPPEGAGAGLSWDDPQYGEGSFQILVSELDSRVEYEVLVEGGSLKIHGRLSLSSEGDGTRLHWVEEGDFGRNPLLGYTARGMASSQREAMGSRLEALRSLLDAGEAKREP